MCCLAVGRREEEKEGWWRRERKTGPRKTCSRRDAAMEGNAVPCHFHGNVGHFVGGCSLLSLVSKGEGRLVCKQCEWWRLLCLLERRVSSCGGHDPTRPPTSPPLFAHTTNTNTSGAYDRALCIDQNSTYSIGTAMFDHQQISLCLCGLSFTSQADRTSSLTALAPAFFTLRIVTAHK